MGPAMSILLNEPIAIERGAALNAQPWERTDERQGYANGFKDRHLDTRLGTLGLRLPQVRGDLKFSPSPLERGQRSERARKLSLAEMYINGVSTRKVTKVMEKRCAIMMATSDGWEAEKRYLNMTDQ
jgi:putative transposase